MTRPWCDYMCKSSIQIDTHEPVGVMFEIGIKYIFMLIYVDVSIYISGEKITRTQMKIMLIPDKAH